MQFIIVGNPKNRRVTAFCEAVTKLGRGVPAIIAYEHWLTGKPVPPIASGSIIKIESPGENSAVRKMLVVRGLQEAGQQNLCDIVTEEHGLIQHMPAWYAGYCSWLNEFAAYCKPLQPLWFMNNVQDIQLMFDKPQCQAWLQQHGIPVPQRLPAVTGYDQLLQHMREQGLHKVFIKPAHASSASGVIAFRKNGDKVQAVTSAEMVATSTGVKLYNSLTVRTYANEQQVAQLINRMAQENIFAEAWLPKATLDNRYFDVRVLVIDGKARHTVIRTSHTIITNLHLGNQRGDMAAFINRFGAHTLAAIYQQAEQAAACFPCSLYMGIDLLLTASGQQIVVLEINAFGDLLPGLLHEGETCYEAQINAMINKLEKHTVC